MAFINTTPHDIIIRKNDGTEITVPRSNTIARVETTKLDLGLIDGIPINKTTYGKVTGLPEYDPEEDIVLVSVLTGACLKDVPGIYIPDTGPTAIRNEQGQIIAVTQLIKS